MILALDLSLTATGWATSLDEHGVYTPTSKGTERLLDLADFLMEFCGRDELPDLAVLEGYSFGSRGRATFSIAEWGGVARYLLADYDIPTAEVPPAVLKKYATGKGTSPKPTMRMELYKRSGLDIADDNTVDALWLLAAAHQATGTPLWSMPKVNVDALDKVTWPTLATTEGRNP